MAEVTARLVSCVLTVMTLVLTEQLSNYLVITGAGEAAVEGKSCQFFCFLLADRRRGHVSSVNLPDVDRFPTLTSAEQSGQAGQGHVAVALLHGHLLANISVNQKRYPVEFG